MTGRNCILIGVHASSDYDDCVVISNHAKPTANKQLVIGTEQVSISRDMTEEEFTCIVRILKGIIFSN